MRPTYAVLLVTGLAAGLAGCAPPPAPLAPQAAVLPPPPTPVVPSQTAPLCVKPAEKMAFDVSALRTHLVLTAITCKTEDQYNAMVAKYKPDLAGSEKILNGYFSRAYGRSGQSRQDDYNTQLISAQSQLAGKAGSLFCRIYTPMYDEVMALPSGEALPAYAASKPIQQALVISECPPQAAPAAKPAPAVKKKS